MPEEQKEDKTEDFKAKWDTEKQRADQEHANYKKATEQTTKTETEKNAISEELQAQAVKVAELQEQLSAKTQTTDYPDLDPDLVDKNVIKTIIQIKAELKAEKEKTAKLEGKATQYEQIEQQRTAKEYRNNMIEKMCKPLDEEFGAKHRNAAKNLADDLVKTGKETEPQDAIDVMNLMRKCYKSIKEKEKPSDTVRTDTGKGGTALPTGEKKPGTTEEVLADMRKDKSWLE